MSTKEKLIMKNKKYEYVAPDGGYGYVICLAVIFILISLTSFLGCFGLIYNDFLIEIGMTSTRVTLVTGINGICVALSGFFTSHLLNFMSARVLAFIASIVHNLGVLGIVFVKSQIPFYICYGVLQGVGMGILYNLAFSILNDYFVKRRLFALSIVQTIIATAAMIAPMFVKWTSDNFGYRGTILCISGVSMHTILAVVLMQPAKMHMKKIEIPIETEMKILLLEDPNDKLSNVPTVKLSDIEGATNQIEEKCDRIFIDDEKSHLSRILKTLVDASLCKTFLLSCASFGTALCVFADTIYVFILPQALYAMDWSQENVAWALSFLMFGDLAMRIVFVFNSKCLLKIGSQEIYVIGILLGLITKLGIQWTENFTAVMVFITCMGLSRCIISVFIPMVIADAVPAEQFTSAMGIFMMLTGCINFVLGPAIGAVRDLTNSYATAFYLLTSLYAIIALFWCIELCYKKNKHKRMRRENSSKSIRSNKGK